MATRAVQPPTNGGDPYAAARAEIARLQQNGQVRPLPDGSAFVPLEPTAEELTSPNKPPCFLRETLPSDASCQQCPVLLPCLQGRINQAPGSVPWDPSVVGA